MFKLSPFTWICGQDKILTFKRRTIIGCILSTLGIAWEQPHRRADITYYLIPRVLEIYWNMIKNRNIFKGDIPGQDAILLAIAFGVIAYSFFEQISKEENNREKKEAKSEPDKKVIDSNSIKGFSLRVC